MYRHVVLAASLLGLTHAARLMESGLSESFTEPFKEVLAPNFIDCAKEIELNFKIDSNDKIVDFNRCETFDNVDSCYCAFLKVIESECLTAADNDWFILSEKETACDLAVEDAIEEEEEIANFLAEWERHIEFDNINDHQKEQKFVELNQRSNVFDNDASAGEEFSWNSYTAQDNLGPALEINNEVSFEDYENGYRVKRNQTILKRGIPRLLRVPSNRGAPLHSDQFVVVNQNTDDEVTETVLRTSLVLLTSTKRVKPEAVTVTKTESVTRYIKTMMVTQTDTFDIYDATTTVKLTEHHTETIRRTTTKTIEPEINTTPASTYTMPSLSTATTPTATPTVHAADWAKNIKEQPARNRDSYPQEFERTNALSRSRNGTFHQKLLAQKNLKQQNVKRGDDCEYASDASTINPYILFLGRWASSFIAVTILYITFAE